MDVLRFAILKRNMIYADSVVKYEEAMTAPCWCDINAEFVGKPVPVVR